MQYIDLLKPFLPSLLDSAAKMATVTTLPQNFGVLAHKADELVGDHARGMDALLQEVQASFESQLKIETLLSLSKKLQAEFKEHLIAGPQTMLPSHNYILPDGEERGTYLAMEVGGSNLRVALVDMDGRKHGVESLRVRCSQISPVVPEVRALEGLAFFDWIAERVRVMVDMDTATCEQMRHQPLRVGIAWAFPIE